MRILATLATTALGAVLLTAPPAHADPGAFTFSGIASEACVGCGVTTGTFEGTLTGVVAGHTYSSARLTMSYTKNAGSGVVECAFGGSGSSGTMSVSDATRSDTWNVVISRGYYAVLLLTYSGASGSGAGAGTYVVVDPVAYTCGGPARIDLRGTGVLT